MKDQASLNLKIVDTPISKNALDGHLMLSATSTGLKLYDHTGAETPIGGEVDESRLLPALDSVPVDRSGNPVVFRAVSEGMDEHTVLYCPFDVDFNDHSAAGGQFIQTGRKSESIVTTEKKFGAGSLNCGENYNTYLNGPLAKPIGASDCTIHFWVKYNNFRHGGSFSLLTGSVSDNSPESEFYAASVGCLTLIVSDDAIELMLRTNSGGSATDIINVTNTINTGEWSHIAITHSGDTWHLFLNGTLLGTGVNTAVTNATHIRIGGGNAYTMNGNLDEFIILDYAKWITDFEPPTQPATTLTKSYEVSDKGAGAVKSVNGQLPDESGNVTVETGGVVDESRLLPENPANGDIPCFDATATVGGGNDANTKILLHFDADEIKDEAAGNAAPVTITKKTGTITVVEGGKWGKCAKYVTGSMTVATNLDELNANNWVVSGWFNPDENNHGVSYPTWLSMDDQNTLGFFFDSTGRYGESDGPLFYLDTPPASGTWHWLAIVKYSEGLRFYLNGAFLNEISAQQRANFCSTLAIGGFAGTHAAGSTERTFSGLVDEVRLQYIPDDEITLWTGTSIAVPDAPYSKPQTVGKWGKLNKSELGGGGISEITVGAGLSGTGTTSDPINLNIANYTSQSTISLSSTEGSVNLAGYNSVNLQETFGNKLTLAERGVVITTASGADVLLNEHASNSPSGFVILDSTGKLPAVDGSQLTNLPAGTVDLSAYTGGINLNSTNDSAVAIKFNSGNPTYNAGLSMSPAGVTLSGYGDVSLEHTGGSYLRLTSGEATLSSNASLALSAGSRLTISASEGIYLGAAGLNTAGGLVKVGDDGKIPSSLYDAGTGGDTSALETRVTTLETTVGTLNTTVDEILADYGEGSGALVYRVVASATEPENPTEGMLWIKTE